MSRASTVGVLVLAAAVGLLLSLYGPAIPELQAAYGVGGGGAALVVSAHFAGAMTGIGWWGWSGAWPPDLAAGRRRPAGRRGGRDRVRAGVAARAGGGVRPRVGFGVVVVEINVLFAEAFGQRATAMLNLLGACFGAGAVLGPLAVAATGGYRGRSAPAP